MTSVSSQRRDRLPQVTGHWTQASGPVLRSPPKPGRCPWPPPLPCSESRRLRDVAIRCVGIPLFGLAIPRLTGALGDLKIQQPLY